MRKKYCVYVLQSISKGSYYIGSTGCIEDRLLRHNSGRSKYTKHGAPWKLIYNEEFSSRSQAIARERELKNWKSRKRLSQLISLRNTLCK